MSGLESAVIDIPLSGKYGQEKVFTIDKEDYKKVKQYNWFLTKNGYVVATVSGIEKVKTVGIHRLIADASSGQYVDHVNRNKLDNRKQNLRIVTNQQNSYNQGPKPNTSSKYKGVSWDKNRNKWSARIKHNYKTCNLGRFDSEEDAARMYNFWAADIHGEYAYLNKITEESL